MFRFETCNNKILMSEIWIRCGLIMQLDQNINFKIINERNVERKSVGICTVMQSFNTTLIVHSYITMLMHFCLRLPTLKYLHTFTLYKTHRLQFL